MGRMIGSQLETVLINQSMIDQNPAGEDPSCQLNHCHIKAVDIRIHVRQVIRSLKNFTFFFFFYVKELFLRQIILCQFFYLLALN